VTDHWNHNIHYGRRLVDLIGPGARDALDVGCGEGWLVRELRRQVPHVVGIDPDADSIIAARANVTSDGVEYLQGNFLTWPFETASFDVVTAVASVHHVDEEAGLRRMAELVRPGGILGVVGIARTSSLRDLVFDAGGAVVTRVHHMTKPYWETPAPKVWPPPHTYGDLRRLSARIVPGRRFRRGAMFRYVLTWTKPSP
jgi:2-polyprenyl-3-methyl-5-hydroxy-6-metoxy-1,4-benzoquinol methylase